MVKRFLLLVMVLAVFSFMACKMEEDPSPAPTDPVNQWTRVNNYPGQAVSGASVFVVGSRAFVGLGDQSLSGNPLFINEFWQFNSASSSWSPIAEFPGTPQADAIAFAIGNHGFVGLGYNNQYNGSTELWAYNTDTDNWARRADFPGGARIRSFGVAVGNKGYVFCGRAGTMEAPVYPRDLWSYDAEQDSWKRLADFPGAGRMISRGFAIGTKIYCGLGENGQYLSDFWEYDTLTNTWSRKADFPSYPRQGACCVTVSEAGYLATGIANRNNENMKEVWKYDPVNNTWSNMVPLPADAPGRYGAVGFNLGEDLYIGLGKNGGGNLAQLLTDFWRISL